MRLFYFLLLLLIAPGISFAQKNPCNTDIQNFDYKSVPSDTTITLSGGTQLTFNRCEFFEIKDCIEYHEIRTLEDAQASGLTTQDSSGNLLISGGMLVISFGSNECGKECLDVPARVRMPLRADSCIFNLNPFRLYKMSVGAGWVLQGSEAKTVEINGRKYLEFYIKCGGRYNADKPHPNIKVKFKAKHGMMLSRITLSSKCPLMNSDFYPKKRMNIIRGKLFCINPDSVSIRIEGIGSDGKLFSQTKPLSALTVKYKRTGCKPLSTKIMRSFLGLFPVRQRHIYRKYIVN